MNCRSCGKFSKYSFLDLGSSPPSNAFLNKKSDIEKVYPLKIFFCESCYLVQTHDFATRRELFNNNYVYFSGFSKTWINHLKKFVSTLENKLYLKKNYFVVEIASNDGTLQEILSKKNYKSLGIEPTNSTAKVAEAKGLSVIKKFFGKDLATSLKKKNLKPDLIVANNVLAHVPKINDFISGLKVLLKPKGIITIEFQHLLNIIQKNQFDTIYHEHYSYLSLVSAKNIFLKHNLEIFDAEKLLTHGGSLRIYIKHKSDLSKETSVRFKKILKEEKKFGLDKVVVYETFQKKVENVRKDFLNFLKDCKQKKKRLCAYGAAAKGNTFFNFLKIKSTHIPFIVDKNPFKVGKYLPGSKIIVKDIKFLIKDKPDYILIVPWNLEKEIIKQLSYTKKWKAKFITAIPNIKIY